MERLPRRTPAAQMDIVGLVFDALATMVEDIPIIGDIVGFVASLFGNSSASNARIARLETIVSKGSSGYDDFNRADTSSLGRGPQMTTDWVTGGNGQALGVQGRAAGLVEGALPADGRRWARYPTPASSSTMTADTIVDDKKVDNRACTSVIVAANAAFTEFVYANVFGTGVYLGRGTRSGNAWSFNDWKQNTSYRVGTAERVEVRASGSGIYQLVVDNTVILEHTDTSYPIDSDHRFVGFAIQCWTGILAIPEYGWRLSAFSLKSESGTFTAIETVETVANGAQTVANNAAVAAGNAAVVATNADDKAIAANNAAAAAAALAAQAVGGQDASNMAFVYNSEKESMRTTYPGAGPFGYYEDASLAVSGRWMVRLAPPNPTTSNYPTMRLGPDFDVISGERIYCEWRQRRASAANFQAALNLQVFNATGGVLNYDLSPVQPPASAADGVWVTYAGIVTMPTGAAKVTPQLKMRHPTGFAATGQILFEEIVIRRALTTSQVVGLDTKIVELTDNNLVTSQQAVTAGNLAQEALLTADIAYENAQYWKDECVVASAGVLLGVNELLIGVVMDVPTGRTRKITDLHFAFYEKPGSITIQTKVVGINAVERVVNTVTVPAGNTRHSLNNLNISVVDKERVFWNVTAQGGAVPANVLQVAVVGVLL